MVCFQYHPKCRDFNDNEGDNEIGSLQSNKNMLNAWYYLRFHQINVN